MPKLPKNEMTSNAILRLQMAEFRKNWEDIAIYIATGSVKSCRKTFEIINLYTLSLNLRN